jgi:hypothetical protein
MDNPDFIIENHGSVFLVRPTNEGAVQHLRENVQGDASWFGDALAVEHRFIENLVAQLREEGWTVE